jgi:NADH:ubiquinone oxidoreductase subunit 6 (subunit J)
MLTVSSGTLAAHSTATAKVGAVASSGITVPFQNAKLTFSYAGSTVNGIVPTNSGIAIGEDITTRYLIPMAFVLLVLLFAAYYIRRMAVPSVPASQK